MLKEEYALFSGSAKDMRLKETNSVLTVAKARDWGGGSAEVLSIAAPGPSGPAKPTAAKPW